MPPSEMGSEDRASNLGELPELKAEVASFLEGSLEAFRWQEQGRATRAVCVKVCRLGKVEGREV